MEWWGWWLVGIAAAVVWVVTAFKPEIDACFERDPAARNVVEILLAYSGLHALIGHRIAHALHGWRVPVLPRLLSQVVRTITGVEIHPRASLGRGIFIDHWMGG